MAKRDHGKSENVKPHNNIEWLIEMCYEADVHAQAYVK
jgi:hypothetical protein